MPIRDYPPEIQGPMRLVMQLKDLFIDCFNLLEEYRAFLLDASLSTDRQLIEQNLNRNLDEIRNLRSEMADLENRARGHYVRNQELRKYITRHYGPNAFRNRYIIRLIARIERNNDPAPIPPELGAMRSPNSLLGDLNANWVPYAGTMDPERVEIPPEFDLHAARTPEGEEMMSITDLYRAAMEVIVKFLVSVA